MKTTRPFPYLTPYQLDQRAALLRLAGDYLDVGYHYEEHGVQHSMGVGTQVVAAGTTQGSP